MRYKLFDVNMNLISEGDFETRLMKDLEPHEAYTSGIRMGDVSCSTFHFEIRPNFWVAFSISEWVTIDLVRMES